MRKGANMVGLTCKKYAATIDAAHGGLLSSFDTAEGVALIKSDRRHGFVHCFPTFGIPLLAPFANRLVPGQLPAQGRAVDMPMNWPDEGLAIHGTVFDRPWDIAHLRRDSAVLSCMVGDAAGANIGQAELTVGLDDETGLTLTLEFRNLTDRAILAGVGFHPWFPGECTLDFTAATRIEVDDRLLPRATTPAGDVRLSMANNGHDLCYAGWSGSARLRRDGWPRALVLESPAPCLHTFVGAAFDALCAEPVSHAPNAAHAPLSRDLAPMSMVEPGAPVSLTMRLYLEPDSPE